MIFSHQCFGDCSDLGMFGFFLWFLQAYHPCSLPMPISRFWPILWHFESRRCYECSRCEIYSEELLNIYIYIYIYIYIQTYIKYIYIYIFNVNRMPMWINIWNMRNLRYLMIYYTLMRDQHTKDTAYVAYMRSVSYHTENHLSSKSITYGRTRKRKVFFSQAPQIISLTWKFEISFERLQNEKLEIKNNGTISKFHHVIVLITERFRNSIMLLYHLFDLSRMR